MRVENNAEPFTRVPDPVTGDSSISIWGGVECTCNRVGDCWLDQMRFSGHDRRADDLERIAALGVTALRYPALWERAARNGGEFDWSWPDQRLPAQGDRGLALARHLQAGRAEPAA